MGPIIESLMPRKQMLHYMGTENITFLERRVCNLLSSKDLSSPPTHYEYDG